MWPVKERISGPRRARTNSKISERLGPIRPVLLLIGTILISSGQYLSEPSVTNEIVPRDLSQLDPRVNTMKREESVKGLTLSSELREDNPGVQHEQIELGVGGPGTHSNSFKRIKRGFRSRPKLRGKIFSKVSPILKKATPTKVIIGAHLGTMAYRKYVNWTSSSNGTLNGTREANLTSIATARVPLTPAVAAAAATNTTQWFVPVELARSNSSARSDGANLSVTVNGTSITGASFNITEDDDNDGNDFDDSDSYNSTTLIPLTLVEILPLVSAASNSSLKLKPAS